MSHILPAISDLAMPSGCSAVSWETQDHRHLWGRNLDFNRLAQGSAITYFPAGTDYLSCVGGAADPLSQTKQQSAYACVGTGLLSVPSAPILFEGINEKGLMGGQLYYRGFAHFAPQAESGKIPLQPPLAVYHLLAQCDTVEQVVQVIRQQVSLVDAPLLGTVPPLHWCFSDRTGETIVIEPDQDGVHIYRNTIGVMTNSPSYPWHRTNLLNYAGIRDLDYDTVEMAGEQIPQCFSGSGAQGLPGDWSSPSRFVRLAYLKKYCCRGADESAGVSNFFHLFQSAAFPLGMVRVSQPGSITALDEGVVPYDYTIYTAVMCSESLRFYWTSYENQRIQYIDLHALKERKEPVQYDFGRQPDFVCRTDSLKEK